MRAFIAIDIPEEIKYNILSMQSKFEGLDIKFVEKENFHFNLKFLGEIHEESIDKIKTILKKIAEKYEPFTLKIKNVGVFPSLSYIRVVWVGVTEGHNIISALADEIDNSLSDFASQEGRKFEPHLTIGRVRSGRNTEELVKVVKSLEHVEIGEMKVNEIKLMRSDLSRAGPSYSKVFSIVL